MNSYGKAFRITTFGESHGKAIGVVIDGCPAGLDFDEALVAHELNRRRPGQSEITTPRKEADCAQVLSGVFEGKTLGTPLTLLIFNKDAKPADYAHLRDVFRPSHADFTYQSKYGQRDYRGGGRSSARETAARVAAGAVAKMLLNTIGIRIAAYVSEVGAVKMPETGGHFPDPAAAEKNIVRCPDPETATRMLELITEVRQKGDTIGGVVSGVVSGVPPGLGEPVFDKLHAELAKAMMSINAAKGFAYGSGFEGAKMRGSAHNDYFFTDGEGKIRTKTNFSGGVQGGISNGENIYFKVAFKPVATLMQTQNSLNTEGKSVRLEGKGRHDPCVLPRAVPIVEAMTAIVLADFYIRSRQNNIDQLVP